MKIEEQTIFAMSADNEPAAKVKNGAKITFVTKDCFNNQLLSKDAELEKLDWEAVNPATGPVYVEEAEPGDVLKIMIEEIRLSGCGTMAAIPENGVLGALVKKSVLKKVPVKKGMVEFSDDIKLPCHPMIGVIGVAPEKGSVSCGEPGSHGGNMDNTRIGAGAVLYLPVFHKGALLSMGDVHACMGDGEIMVTGVEIPAEVTVTVEVLKGLSIKNPMLEDAESCYTIASDENVEKAVFEAVYAMTKLVSKQRGMTLEEAGMLLSAAGNLQFCQVVDPKRTVRMEISKAVLNKMI